MRKYVEMMKAQLKLNFAYSAWYWAGTFSALLRLTIIYYFWHAVYANRTSVADFSLENMITYAVIAMILDFYVSGVAREVAEHIREGTIAIELMRPYDLMAKLVAVDLGQKLNESIRQALPIILISIIFLNIQLPASWQSGILFAVSALLGVLIGTVLDLGIGLLAFWTVNIFGLSMLRSAVISFFAGSLIPISLFPGWLQTISAYLPFQSMVYVPVSIYTGQLTGAEAYSAIGIQLFWLTMVFIVIRSCWSLAIRKVTIFGG